MKILLKKIKHFYFYLLRRKNWPSKAEVKYCLSKINTTTKIKTTMEEYINNIDIEVTRKKLVITKERYRQLLIKGCNNYWHN